MLGLIYKLAHDYEIILSKRDILISSTILPILSFPFDVFNECFYD